MNIPNFTSEQRSRDCSSSLIGAIRKTTRQQSIHLQCFVSLQLFAQHTDQNSRSQGLRKRRDRRGNKDKPQKVWFTSIWGRTRIIQTVEQLTKRPVVFNSFTRTENQMKFTALSYTRIRGGVRGLQGVQYVPGRQNRVYGSKTQKRSKHKRSI